MILNGSLLQVPLIRAAKEEGYYTIVCDRTATNPGIQLADKHYQISVLDSDSVMKVALKDKLHQPYREKLVPGLEEITKKIKNEEDIIGCVLSGAGPSILLISKQSGIEKVKSIVSETWDNLNIKSDILTVDVEENGAYIISNGEEN